MQTVVYNGKIYVNKDTFTQALLIDDDIIIKIGTSEEILAAASPNCTKIDAKGKAVIPGLNDSHLHVHGVGVSLTSVPLYGSTSIVDIVERGKKFLADNPPAKGSVVIGRGWNQDYFTDEVRLLTRHDLDKISTEFPIIFNRACGHVVVCNTKALEVAGITSASTPTPGGEFYLGKDGEPNGLFSENANSMIFAIIPSLTVETIASHIKAAMAYASSHGITSVQTNDIDEDGYENMIAAYRMVYAAGDATVRTNHQSCFRQTKNYAEFLAKGYKTGAGDKYNKMGPLKMFIDGSLGARTALMRNTYADESSTSGICCMTQEHLNNMIEIAAKNDSQVAVHAIGDKAIEMVLDGYNTVTSAGHNPLRHGVVHCQITDMPLVKRFKENDILAYVQPIFIHYDMHIVASRVGKELASTSYAFGSMYRMGIHTSFGSDSPVEDLNTMDNIYCAVARKDLSGKPVEGYYPAEAVDMASAIDQYTLSGAYASFEEDIKGRLLPGYYADLVILSDDIFSVPESEIRNIKALTTMMGGKVVYQR